MMKFISIAVVATVFFAEAAEAKQKRTKMTCKTDLADGAVQGVLNLSQGKRKDETLRNIRVRGHFSNIATYVDDYLYLNLFSDDACETFATAGNDGFFLD